MTIPNGLNDDFKTLRAAARAQNPVRSSGQTAAPSLVDEITDDETSGDDNEEEPEGVDEEVGGGPSLLEKIQERLDGIKWLPDIMKNVWVAGVGVLAIVILLVALGLVFAFSRGGPTTPTIATSPRATQVAVPTAQAGAVSNGGNASPVVIPLVPPIPTYNGWNLNFKVPSNRLEWSLGWGLVWLIMIMIMVLYRSETLRRSEVWDFINVTIMLVLATLAMIFAKGIVVIALDQCKYWFVTECSMGPLSAALIDSGAMWVSIIAGVAVFIGSAVATFTGRRDFTSWAIGTYCVGLLAKLLLPVGAAQLSANAIMVLGLLIYVIEIGGFANGKLALGGLLALVIGLVVMAVATIVLSLAFGYLATATTSWPYVAGWLYHGRFLWGLLTGWLVATAVTFFLTPAMTPQVERLATGSIVVGDSEKIDTIIFLMMVVGLLFVFNWAPIVAAFT
jgi:hypothetical protein